MVMLLLSLEKSEGPFICFLIKKPTLRSCLSYGPWFSVRLRLRSSYCLYSLKAHQPIPKQKGQRSSCSDPESLQGQVSGLWPLTVQWHTQAMSRAED